VPQVSDHLHQDTGFGETDGVRWCGSTVGRDALRCTECGRHWAIPIDEPISVTGSQVA